MSKHKIIFTTKECLMKSSILRIICTIEIIFLTWLIMQCLRGKYNLTFSAADLIPSDTPHEGSVQLLYDGDNAYYELSNLEDSLNDTVILTTDSFKLFPGAYNVRANYYSSAVSGSLANTICRSGTLTLTSDHHGVYFYFPDLTLTDAYTAKEQTVQIKSPIAIDDLTLSIKYNSDQGGGTLDIYNIQITEICAYKYVFLIIALVIFILIDITAIKILSGTFTREAFLLYIICAATILPFIADFSYTGHDVDFHLSRIVCLADEIKLGNYFPAIYSTALNGYGYASPLFYNQFFLYIPAILYCCGFSLNTVYNAYIIILSIATCLIMYGSTLKIFKRKDAALLAAALYTLNPVRLTNIFTRGALGEYTAQTFLPLIVLGFYNIYTSKKGEKIPLHKYIPLVIGLTCVLLSHVLTIMMCAILIIVFCIFMFRKTLRPNIFITLCKAAALTLLINLSSLVPFIDSYSMDLVVKHNNNYIQSHGTYPIQLFNSIVDGFQRSSNANSASNEMSLSIGFSLTLGMVFFICCLIYQKGNKGKIFRFTKICFALLLFTLFLSTAYMPYDVLDILPPGIYSLLTAFQFPFRWLIFSSLFGVYCSIYALPSIRRTFPLSDRKHATIIASFSIIAALCVNTGQIYADQLETNSLPKFSNNSYAYNMTVSNGEYLLYGTDLNIAYNSLVTSSVPVENYYHNGTKSGFYVDNSLGDVTNVILPIFCYDNYIAYDITGNTLAISKDAYNRISVEIPAGYSGDVYVIYHFRNLWKAAIFVSATTVLIIIGYGFYLKRQEKNIILT